MKGVALVTEGKMKSGVGLGGPWEVTPASHRDPLAASNLFKFTVPFNLF